MATEKKIEVTLSSGNVFADLGFPDAEERKTKVRVMVHILQTLEQRKLTDRQAASLLGITTLKILALKHFAIDDFTLERLLHFANDLEYEVVILLKHKPASEGSAGVIVETAA
jgi:predicted XRE-type DNA-binding protein